MRAVLIGGVVAVLAIGAFLFGANGGFEDASGPAEEMGQTIDQSMKDAGQAIDQGVKDAGQAIENTVD